MIIGFIKIDTEIDLYVYSEMIEMQRGMSTKHLDLAGWLSHLKMIMGHVFPNDLGKSLRKKWWLRLAVIH